MYNYDKNISMQEIKEVMDMLTIHILIAPQVEQLDLVGPLSYVNKIQPNSTRVY